MTDSRSDSDVLGEAACRNYGTPLDRSVLSLIRQLLVRPGAVARDFIEGRRRRYCGPFAFLVVCVAVGAAAIALSGFPVVTVFAPG